MNKVYAIKRMLFAVLAIICVGALAKNTAYAVDALSITDCFFWENKDYDGLRCEVSVNNNNITALVYQVIDSEGKTVLIKTEKVQIGPSPSDSGDHYSYAGWGYYGYTGGDKFNLKPGEYTMVVSDFDGKYGSVEQQFSVAAEKCQCDMFLRGTDSTTAVLNLYIPEQYIKINIDGIDFNPSDTQEYNKDGVIFHREGKTRWYTYYKDVPAKNFDDEIKIYLYEENETELIGNKKEPMISYSVRRYLEKRLENTYNPDYEICKALNDYGYAASTYFNYNAPDSPVEISDAGDLSAYRSVVSGSCPGLDYIGSSLILDGTVAIRHYFSGNPEGLEATITGDHVEDYRVQIVDAGSYYYVEIRNILASKFDTPFDLTIWPNTVSGNDVGFRLKNYSVLTYCDKVINNNPNSELANVAKALVQYSKAVTSAYNKAVR